MPRLYHGPVAQLVRHPNKTVSDPFLVPMCKADVLRFAKRIIEDQWPEWKGCLDANGRVDVPKMEAKIAADDFDSGSARLDCAHDGRFLRTLKVWCARVESGQLGEVGRRERPDGCLSRGEMTLVLEGESGYHLLSRLGVEDIAKFIARTAIKWASSIEEWDPPKTADMRTDSEILRDVFGAKT